MNKIFHIGFMRSASTWMQEEVFPKLPLTYGNNNSQYSNIFYNHILKDNPLEYDKEYIKKEYDKLSIDNLPFLFSEETIAGNLLEPRPFTPRDMLERIKGLGGDIKIMVVLRNQPSLIWSLYKEYLKIGGCCDLHGFLYDEPSAHLLSYLHYRKLLDYCHYLFGKGNVFAFFFEHLAKNPLGFVHTVLPIIYGKDVSNMPHIQQIKIDLNPVNRGYPIEIHNYLRWLNKQSDTRKNPGGSELFKKPRYEGIRFSITDYCKTLPKDKQIPKAITKELNKYCERYKEGNQFLKDAPDAKKMGYPI